MQKQRPNITKVVLQLVACLFGGGVFLFITMLFAQVLGAGGGDWGDPIYLGNPKLLEYDYARANFITGITAGVFLSVQVGFSLYISRGLRRSHRIAIAVCILIVSIAVVNLFGPQVFDHPRRY